MNFFEFFIEKILRKFCIGERCEEDPRKGFYYSKLAAHQGDTESQYNTGWCYEKGFGMLFILYFI